MSISKTEYAMQLHDKGFNCAQSVALPFCEEMGVDAASVMRGMEGFGAGMGSTNMTCGALSGAVFVLGLKYSDGNLETPASKANTYAITKNLCKRFTEQCGSFLCCDIKGIKNGRPLVSCSDCIRIAVKLLEDAL